MLLGVTFGAIVRKYYSGYSMTCAYCVKEKAKKVNFLIQLNLFSGLVKKVTE